jgi:hypothetical protein
MTYSQLEEQFKHHWVNGRKPYVDCQQGWYSIISELDYDIRKLYPDYRIGQIKEKFGRLRFYFELTNNQDANTLALVQMRVSEAEEESSKTCECCGESGTLCRRRGWLKTLCQECFKDWMEFSEEPGEYGVVLK